MTDFNISVIIPVYNAEQYIRRAIESVLMQPEVLELLLVNDGSIDNSEKICIKMQESDKRIVLLQHPGKKNRGVSASRNLGIKNARHAYIAFLDADDHYLPRRFKQTRACFEADESLEGIYEMVGLHTGATEIIPYSFIENVSTNILFENLQPLGEKVWFHIDGLTVKRTVFDKAGFFDESLRTSEDTLQWFKMAAVARLLAGNIDYPVATAERRNGSLTTNMKLVQKDFVLMLLKLFEYCKKRRLNKSRKELVLTKLLFFAAAAPYSQHYKGIKKISLFILIIVKDPLYILFRSQTFRRYAGDIMGYNRLIHFFTKHNKMDFNN